MAALFTASLLLAFTLFVALALMAASLMTLATCVSARPFFSIPIIYIGLCATNYFIVCASKPQSINLNVSNLQVRKSAGVNRGVKCRQKVVIVLIKC